MLCKRGSTDPSLIMASKLLFFFEIIEILRKFFGFFLFSFVSFVRLFIQSFEKIIYQILVRVVAIDLVQELFKFELSL